jgi:hypothetical protein
MSKTTKRYSTRRRQEFSRMSKAIRKGMNWSQYEMGEFIRSAQYVVSNFENVKCDRLTRTSLARRRGRRITRGYEALQAGKIRQGMTPAEAYKATPMSKGLRAYVKGEHDGDITDTRTRAAAATGKPRIETPAPADPRQQTLPFDKPPVSKTLPSPAPVPEPEPELILRTVEMFGVEDTKFYAVKTGEKDYSLAMFSICEWLGIGDTRDQAAKMLARGFEDLVGRHRVSIPGTRYGNRVTWLIKRQGLMGWLATIHPNNVAEDKREGLKKLQRECMDVLDRYFFQGAAVNPRFDASELLPVLLEQMKLMNRRSETTELALQSLIRTNAELALQLTQVNRTREAVIADVLSDYEVISPGRFRHRATGVVYLNRYHTLEIIKQNPQTQEWCKAYGVDIEKLGRNYFAWMRDLVIPRRTYVSRRDVGPPLANPHAGGIEQDVYGPEDIQRLHNGTLAWIALVHCKWPVRKVTINGTETEIHYPDLQEAQKLLVHKGFDPQQIQQSINFVVNILRLPGRPEQNTGN